MHEIFGSALGRTGRGRAAGEQTSDRPSLAHPGRGRFTGACAGRIPGHSDRRRIRSSKRDRGASAVSPPARCRPSSFLGPAAGASPAGVVAAPAAPVAVPAPAFAGSAAPAGAFVPLVPAGDGGAFAPEPSASEADAEPPEAGLAAPVSTGSLFRKPSSRR